MSSHLRLYFAALEAFVFAAFEHRGRYFRRPGKDFTRRRLLPFERLVFLALSLLKRSNSVELDSFFQFLRLPTLPASKSALTQARKKLLPVFFEDFFRHSAAAFFQCFGPRRWRGFRLWATDGTGFRLPDCPGVGDTFGWHGNQHDRVPSTRLSLCCDLLNFVAVDARLHPREVSEAFVATCFVQTIPTDVLMVYDRGYASQIIPFLHQLHGSQCVVRMPVGRSHAVRDFVASGKREQIITETLGQRARESLRDIGVQLKDPRPAITSRLVRVDLPTGETEVLLTTLTDRKKFPHTQFARVYAARWGIETCFFVLKSFLQLTNFSAHLPGLVHADIFAALAFFNLLTASLWPLREKIKQLNRRRRHDYQPNRNVAAGLLKLRILRWFLGDEAKNEAKIKGSINDFHQQILRSLEAVRPGKSKERRRRLMRGTERHVHEKNYRRAF